MQEEKEENGVGGVEEEIGEVMAGGTESVALAVEHVGEPGEGMIVAGVTSLKSPDDGRPGKAGLDVGIFGDVKLVVVGNEVVPEHG